MTAQALAFAVAWTLAEPMRGGLGLQFPWNPIALVWAASDQTMQAAAFTGTYGLSLLTVAAAALTAPWFLPGLVGASRPLPPPRAVAAALFGAGELRLQAAQAAARHGRSSACRPGRHRAAPQVGSRKAVMWLRRHLELTARPQDAPAKVVIWPESAVPYDIDGQIEVRDYLAPAVPAGGYVLAGGDRYATRPQARRSPTTRCSRSAAGASVLARYDKVDLVPFGEFLPFRAVLRSSRAAEADPGHDRLRARAGPRHLAASRAAAGSPLICYEAAFPGRATGPADRPAWLVNITNDAWFGRSSGPYQHLAMVRMRAVEEGLPLVRAANTGISVVTDPYGRVRHQLGPGHRRCDRRLAAGGAGPGLPFASRHAPWVPLALLLATSGLSVLVELQRPARATADAPRSERPWTAMSDLPHPTDVRVGHLLRERRLQLGMSQERLGALLGVTYQQVQKYERGANRIGSSRLQELCRVLGVRTSYFFDEQPAAPGLAEAGGRFDRAGAPEALEMDAESRDLLAAFQRLEDPQLRRRLVDLVRAMGDMPYQGLRRGDHGGLTRPAAGW